MKKKVICIVQARMSSTRLPGKSMALINKKPCIERVISRIKRSALLDEIWLACSSDKKDDVLESFIKGFGIKCYRGSLHDVLSRYVEISKFTKADYIVRITGDCPLVDPELIDKAVLKIINNNLDYVSNTINRTFPDGIDVEVFSYNALMQADINSQSLFLREHVTPYISGKVKNKSSIGCFKRKQFINETDYSYIRLTLDRKEDLKLLNIVYRELEDDCSWKDVVEFLLKQKNLLNINKHIEYNEKTESLLDE